MNKTESVTTPTQRRVLCSSDTFVQGGSFVLRMNICGKKPTTSPNRELLVARLDDTKA